MTYTGKRAPCFIRLKMAADKEGKILAMEGDCTVDHGPYAELGDAVAQRVCQHMGSGYMIPNIYEEGRVVCTNHSWGCAFRAFGSPQGEFASEVLIDELAEKVGMDPLEFRYKNVYREGDTTPSGTPPDVIVLPGLIDKLRPLYNAAHARAEAETTPEKRRGVGISFGIYNVGLESPTHRRSGPSLPRRRDDIQ